MSSPTIIQTESLSEFYQRTNQEIPFDLLEEQPSRGHFNVKLSSTIAKRTPYNRRDYFKICLSDGSATGKFTYNNQEFILDRPCLIFTNPSVPASIEIPSGAANRYYCLFNNRFIDGHIHPDIQYACPLFNPSLPPIIWLTPEERDRLHLYFAEQQLLLKSDYSFKWDMIRNLLLLLIHEGIRLQHASLQPTPVSDRVVKGFFTLLNQQFPVDSPENALKHLSPSDFANLLHVHVNYLNHIVKKHTGKSTRTLIQERVIHEAKMLLQNTDWNIAEIAFALGFEYPSHFNKQFKQLALVAPMEFRTAVKPLLHKQL
jgi:AraC family transcriptional regulator, transcriptional activator of pobA